MDSIDNTGKPHIKSESALRELISGYPKIMDKRLQAKLDRYCLELIEHSTMVVIGYNDNTTPMSVLRHYDVRVCNDKLLALDLPAEQPDPEAQISASLYFLVAGIGHSLRVNGSIAKTGKHWVLSISCAYLHCARAAARAKLWEAKAHASAALLKPAISPNEFVLASPYLLLKTTNAKGQTELSPRGDESGFVTMIGHNQLFIPERPGNKVAVSMRNIIDTGNVEVLMFVPQSALTMHIRGTALLSRNAHLLSQSKFKGKYPKLGILLSECCFSISKNDAIQNKNLWSHDHHVDAKQITRFSKALAIHMNGSGLAGKLTAPVINAVVKNDMKNLY